MATPLDQAAGGIFFLVALAILCCFVVLAVKYFCAPTNSLTVAVRYGAAASFVAFGVRIWMSVVTRGRFVPDASNLLLPHAVGFHGLQVLPVLLAVPFRGAPLVGRLAAAPVGSLSSVVCSRQGARDSLPPENRQLLLARQATFHDRRSIPIRAGINIAITKRTVMD